MSNGTILVMRGRSLRMAIHSATVMSSGRGEEGGSSGGSGVSTEKGE